MSTKFFLKIIPRKIKKFKFFVLLATVIIAILVLALPTYAKLDNNSQMIKPRQDPHYQYHSYPRDFSRLYRRASENSEKLSARSNVYEIYNIRDPSLRRENNPYGHYQVSDKI
ncbi:11632_t:CDS:2 [Dentiscutata heterogama]|uniref:11632_t:CDS:1 n=1 Tax=Dentiscutata heterogama TaxID=1316150 RepID=A0ACA9LKH7_9GLOM|nr:11632_t:CDS:2 [Dentiscutata heterogama]